MSNDQANLAQVEALASELIGSPDWGRQDAGRRILAALGRCPSCGSESVTLSDGMVIHNGCPGRPLGAASGRREKGDLAINAEGTVEYHAWGDSEDLKLAIEDAFEGGARRRASEFQPRCICGSKHCRAIHPYREPAPVSSGEAEECGGSAHVLWLDKDGFTTHIKPAVD